MKKTLFFFVGIFFSLQIFSNPVTSLLERIDEGASHKFKIELDVSGESQDYFELDQYKDRVVVRGNNYVSIATGVNWYLKYYANIHLSWNGMTAKLPKILPSVKKKERHETNAVHRYYLNYCTFSYSMAFWDWKRWEQEIDWMAMHGVNLSLALVGTEMVWKNVLEKLGYTKGEINNFVSGSGFLAWWHMNNLEGWGGPNPDSWYEQQAHLQQQIVKRMREYGIEPVLPGYAGMIPSNAKEKLGVNVTNPGLWCGFPRPAFLQPGDKNFERISDLYYAELTNLFGKANYYAIDPFHEGGSIKGVDLDRAGKTIMEAMKKVNPAAIWVVQAWQTNPRPLMIENLRKGDLLILDLFSESRPMWGPKWSSWYRETGYGKHEWVYCMLLNFGGRTGIYGKMQPVIDGYFDAQLHQSGTTLKGVGATMEAIENNSVMFELLYELPWRSEHFCKNDWLRGYVKARYGKDDEGLYEVWRILSNTVYNSPKTSTQEGTTESVFAANPALDIQHVSCCSATTPFYNTDSLLLATRKMVSEAGAYVENNNFEYDLIDLIRQAIANKAFYLQQEVAKAYREGKRDQFHYSSQEFLSLLLIQDCLLSLRSEFSLDHWLIQAREKGQTQNEKKMYEWNARTQITVWGNRESADMLHNYAYKEWAGVLKEVYYPRWQAFFLALENQWGDPNPVCPDYFDMDEKWTKNVGEGNRVIKNRKFSSMEKATTLFYQIFGKE